MPLVSHSLSRSRCADGHMRLLLDVVHNRTSGLDVDKLDYLARDSLAVFGVTHACDVARILNAAMRTPAANLSHTRM